MRQRGDRFEADAPDFFSTNCGPAIAVFRSPGDDAARMAALDEDRSALAEPPLLDGQMDWEHPTVTASRR
ncbi:hypothetical protein GCM10027427_14360 [Pseudoclavibacter terrae]